MKLYSIKKLVLSLIAVIFLTGMSLTLNATHIVGGDITYKYLGNDEYEITLTQRRDCYNGEEFFDDPAIIGIFRQDGWFMKGLGDKGSGVIEIPLSFSDTLNETITSECGFIGEQVCVETTTYRKVVKLPYLDGGYTLAYLRCCRNITLNNIIDPVAAGSAYTVDIGEDAMSLGNSNPTFNDWADVYICKDQDLIFDQSATDIDGDSLAYSLCTPTTALSIENPVINSIGEYINNPPPYEEIQWQTPYSLDDLMGGTPLTIDGQSGLITAKPNLVGQFLIGVCVEEFRNGVSIGKVIRNFEYNVRVCSEAPHVDFTVGDTECGGLKIDFENTSTGADTYEWFFDYPSTSPDSTLTTAAGENPSFTYAGGGTYEVHLLGTRDADGCMVEVVKDVVISGEGVSADFTAVVTSCNENGDIVLHLDDTSVATGAYDRNWSLSQNATEIATSTDDEWDVILTSDDDVSIQLITGVGACMDTLVKTISSSEMRPQATIDFEVLECIGDSIVVKVNSDFTAPSGVSFDSTKIEIFTGFSGEYTVEDANEIIITILNIDIVNVVAEGYGDNGCNVIVEENFDHDEVAIELAIEDDKIICIGDSTKLISNPNSDWTYTWDPTDGLIFGSATDHSDPWAKPTQTTTYNVTVTDGICSKDTSITIIVMESSEFEIVGETILCDTDDVKLWAEGASVGVMEFEWSTDPNFGTISHTGDTLKTTLSGDSETYYARIKDGTDCTAKVKSITVEKQTSATMNFTSSFECGTYIICYTSTSGLSDELTSWDFGDPNVTTDIATGNDVCYTYPAAGNYDVTISDLSGDCPGEAVVQTINVPELVDITVEQDMYEICEGESIVINSTSTTSGAVITYHDATGAEIGTGSPWEYTPTSDMVITATATDSNGCTASHDITVVVNEFEADLSLELTPDETGFAGQEYTLEVIGGLEGYTYEWSTGATSSSIIIAPLETTTYCVTVTDPNGCTEEFCQTITIDTPVKCNEDDIYLPTAFSPNGDDHNDIFIVRSNVLTSIDMLVYDRWGVEIFATKTLGTGWNGTLNGKELSSDVYAYCIRAVCVNGEEYIKVGNVSLLK